jgi:hypothetical protein
MALDAKIRTAAHNVLSLADGNTNTSTNCDHKQRKGLDSPMEPDLFEDSQKQVSSREDNQKRSNH